MMKAFIGTYVNKIDSKARISVPAPFRTFVQAKGLNGVALYPSLTGPCIEGCGIDRIEDMVDRMDDAPVPSVEEDAIAHLIFASARETTFDVGGRIVMPDEFLDKANLSNQGAFVGKGRTFQIWNPNTLADAQADMLARALADRQAMLEEKRRTT